MPAAPDHATRLLGLGTAVPAARVPQPTLADAAARCANATPEQQQKVRRIFERTGVAHRGSVIAHKPTDPAHPEPLADAFPPPTGPDDQGPTVAQRMAWYEREALPLAAAACADALRSADVLATEIAQLVTVSCTGFAAPGIDITLIEALGLPAAVGRTSIGFMGCHGALNGLRVADALARTAPGRPVLLCCVELCSLHFQYGYDLGRIVSNALFADGAAAAVIAHDARVHPPSPRLLAQASTALPDSADDMTWRIGDHGFEMTLSPRVPELVGRHVRPWLCGWLEPHGLTPGDVAGWAIHPGGPKVIDAVTDALGLPADAADASRGVLADHGNMSSPTVLFILERLRRAEVRGPAVVIGFGPGLVAEAALIELP